MRVMMITILTSSGIGRLRPRKSLFCVNSPAFRNFFFYRNWETLAHLLKGSLGTGILAMPRAFHHAGIAVGIIATLAVGTMCTYCLHVLVRTQYILCKRHKVPLLSYPESMEKALEVGPKFLRPVAPFSGYVTE